VSRLQATWTVLVLALGVAVALSFFVGEGDLSNEALRSTLLRLRAWRLANTILAGAALAGAGVLVQGARGSPSRSCSP